MSCQDKFSCFFVFVFVFFSHIAAAIPSSALSGLGLDEAAKTEEGETRAQASTSTELTEHNDTTASAAPLAQHPSTLLTGGNEPHLRKPLGVWKFCFEDGSICRAMCAVLRHFQLQFYRAQISNFLNFFPLFDWSWEFLLKKRGPVPNGFVFGKFSRCHKHASWTGGYCTHFGLLETASEEKDVGHRTPRWSCECLSVKLTRETFCDHLPTPQLPEQLPSLHVLFQRKRKKLLL